MGVVCHLPLSFKSRFAHTQTAIARMALEVLDSGLHFQRKSQGQQLHGRTVSDFFADFPEFSEPFQ